jgi:hypothetical protein
MRDLEYGNKLRLILVENDVNSLNLDFSDVEQGNTTPLTKENRREFISNAIQLKHVLTVCK